MLKHKPEPDFTYYWSRVPGKFTDKKTGKILNNPNQTSSHRLEFTGNVQEWYETLVETIKDAFNKLNPNKKIKTIYAGDDVFLMLQFSMFYRPSPSRLETSEDIFYITKNPEIERNELFLEVENGKKTQYAEIKVLDLSPI